MCSLPRLSRSNSSGAAYGSSNAKSARPSQRSGRSRSKGCHGSGKTFTVSGLVPYELLAYDESIVLTIAPTLRQVKLMWNEIESAIKAVPLADA